LLIALTIASDYYIHQTFKKLRHMYTCAV